MAAFSSMTFYCCLCFPFVFASGTPMIHTCVFHVSVFIWSVVMAMICVMFVLNDVDSQRMLSNISSLTWFYFFCCFWLGTIWSSFGLFFFFFFIIWRHYLTQPILIKCLLWHLGTSVKKKGKCLCAPGVRIPWLEKDNKQNERVIQHMAVRT